MADIKSYSLWIERIRSAAPASYPGAIPINTFGYSSSRRRAYSASGGAGKTAFDRLDFTIPDNHAASAQLLVAFSSGANLGKGRLGILASGCARPVLEFDEVLVESASVHREAMVQPTQFAFTLSFERLRILWQPGGQAARPC